MNNDLSLITLLEAQELERERISKDLHDIVGSLLVVARLKIKIAKEDSLDKKNIDINHLSGIEVVIDEAIQEVRKLSHNLSTDTLKAFGLKSAIKELLEYVVQGGTLKVNYFESDIIEDKINLNIKENIFRVIQELVANALKHSQAEILDIKITLNHGFLNLSFRDNGIGFSEKEHNISSGIGLINIKKRIYSLNGKIEINSDIGKGTIVKIKVPII